jgi:hypothetical protein
MAQSRTINDLIVKNAVAVVAIGSLVLFAAIDILIFLANPTLSYKWMNQLLLTAVLILVVSLPLAMVLKRKGF